MDARVANLESELARLREEVAALKLKDEIVNRLNEYGYTIDAGDYEAYEANFTEDCLAVMSFSSHRGRTGLGLWMSAALVDVQRGLHLSSNFDVKFVGSGPVSKAREASVRSKLHAACALKSGKNAVLTLGGVYNWKLARIDDTSPWLISFVEFKPYWSRGDDSLLRSHEG